ncbi:MAG: hypothetical protein KGJ23_13415 [Euryarchaeota archaeon]|nr:hypothetical protein [Euryarchaeota archaeon]MDE1837598.1 hypothetical protein [Euryarchaeota archaeon]MDE1881251.1 hypothetical protein [Euryarchaeota archaeon]MDE2045909.1 hypothetical protein [Thermoplasmata archaeon]
MDTIPSPFDRFIEVNRNERFYASWYSVPVKVDQLGRIDRVPDVKDGLLVLTDKGMVQCVKHYNSSTDFRTFATAYASTRIMDGVTPLLKIPFGDLVGLDAVRIPPHPYQLLVVRFHRVAASPDAPYLEGGHRHLVMVKLLLGRKTDLEEVWNKIRAAGRAAGCPAFRDPGSASKPLPSTREGVFAQVPEPEDSPIRFNAQDDP